MEYVKLNSGEQMPILGTGTNTYGKENNEYRAPLTGDFTELEHAIELGYRLIDSAKSYRNEDGTGDTIANSGVNREEFFITTKIHNTEKYVESEEAIRETIESSLENFHTDYIDLYLIHHPIENKEYFRNTWRLLEEYYKNGKIKSIGVSNFSQELLEEMKEFAVVKPAVNQLQINLKEKQQDLIDYLKKSDIQPMAWGPMGATDEQKEVLAKIGQNYNKTWAQVLLRYQTQRGIVVIPKSHNPENQAANIDIFDFTLTEDEMKQISEL
jgi:diketogulonate reductase-like aldo/keto reductase